jgi:hypothetical protein
VQFDSFDSLFNRRLSHKRKRGKKKKKKERKKGLYKWIKWGVPTVVDLSAARRVISTMKRHSKLFGKGVGFDQGILFAIDLLTMRALSV